MKKYKDKIQKKFQSKFQYLLGLFLFAVVGLLLFVFHREFYIGNNQGNLIIEATWQKDELSQEYNQELRYLVINGEQQRPEDFYRTTFKINEMHMVDPYFSSIGQHQIIEIQKEHIQQLTFEYLSAPTAGILTIKLDGKVHSQINTYSENWEKHHVKIDFDSYIGISRDNVAWYTLILLAITSILLFVIKKCYSNLTVREFRNLFISTAMATFLMLLAYKNSSKESLDVFQSQIGKYKLWIVLFGGIILGYVTLKVLQRIFNKLKHSTTVVQIMTVLTVSYFAIFLLENSYSRLANMRPEAFGYNWLLFIIFYGLFILCFNSIKWSGILIVVLATIFGIANSMMIDLRLMPIQTYHLLQVKEMHTVSDKIHISLTNTQLESILCALIIIVLLVNTSIPRLKPTKFKLPIRIAIRVGLIAMLLLVGVNQVVSYAHIELNFWRMQSTYAKNGFLLSMLSYDTASKIEKPQGYSEKNVNNILSKYSNTKSSKKLPNIIIIQNESQADFTNLPGIELSEDPLAFQHALNQRHSHGEVNASVYGGGTAITEYEVLTGNTTASLLKGIFPYQQLINKPHNSVVTTLKAQGYHTIAIHPYYEANYRRNVVYPLLGFDESYFLDGSRTIYEFMEPEYERYFTSDKSLFEGIANLYDTKGTSPLFTFVVTMQGHGGYKDKTYPTEITLNMPREQSLSERVYFTSLKKSDEAFKDLIEYFREFDEPTVIVMYGDHHPALSESFNEKFIDKEDKGSLYRTPYIIWSNFELERRENQSLSPNFLMPYLFSLLSNSDYPIEMPAYFQFLLEVMEETPVYARWGFQNADGSYVEAPNTELYKQYEEIEYMNVTAPHKFTDFYE